MADITFECPHCKQHLSIEEGGAGMSVNCPSCDRPLVVPSPNEIATARQKVIGGTVENITGKVEGGVASVISAFVSEQQDPAQVAEIFSKVTGILTKDERISYISIQNKPVVNVQPDAIVLTNRRFIIYRPKLFGRVDFEDYIWRDLKDARLKEGIMGSTLTLQTVSGKAISIDYLPKPQARKAYSTAQEMEERVREERRLREMEETRAAAGGVVIQGSMTPGFGSPTTSGEDPVQKLKQLKDMMDAALITQGEYEAKRQAILSRM